jgi:hypothetical protein
MKKRLFARCLLLASLFPLLLVGICRAEDHGQGKEGSYVVTLAFDQGRPVIGTNRVRITVKNATSQAVAGARVKVDYFMPSLREKPSMMGRSTTAKASGGAYEATLKFSMKGEWRIMVTVTGPERTDEIAFAFEVE